MIDFTIITATKNPKKKIFLENLDSINKQNIKNFEHLIIDGSDQINIDEIIKPKYKFKSKKFYNLNKGIYNALNYGISRSKGKYIIILHSDDKFYSNNSLTNVSKYISQDYDLILFGVKITGKNYSRYWKLNNIDEINTEECKLPPHTGLVVKKKLYENYGLFDENYKISSDIDFMIRIFKKSKELNIMIVDDILIEMNSGGASTNFIGIIKSNFETYKILKKNNIKNPFINVLKKIISKLYQLRFSKNFKT